MALPQAIQQQVEQAEALQQQVYEPEAVTPPVEETPAQEAPPSNVVELPHRADPPTAETQKSDNRTNDPEYWKSRFSTLQGKFNAEVPQLYQQLKEQGQQIAQLTKALQEREVKPEAKTQSVVTEKDVDDYGQDLIDLIRRVSSESAEKVVARASSELVERFGAMQEQVGHVTSKVEQTSAERFWDTVKRIVPDWTAVDNDPDWRDWLDTAPRFSKRTYRELAVEAISAGDAQAVAELVAMWKGVSPSRPTSVPAPNPQAELQRQVTPSSSRSSTPPPQQSGRIWTRQEYEAAMDVRNVQRLGQKKADELEAEANAAVAEGRVRW